jgi:hypothetical protein
MLGRPASSVRTGRTRLLERVHNQRSIGKTYITDHFAAAKLPVMSDWCINFLAGRLHRRRVAADGHDRITGSHVLRDRELRIDMVGADSLEKTYCFCFSVPDAA